MNYCTLYAQVGTAQPRLLSSNQTTTQSPSSTNDQPPPLKRYKMLSQDTRNRSASNQVSRTSGISAELDRYLAEELSFSSCQENGLSFWISREQSYPLLAHLAEDLVSAQASQVNVERVFSVCGDLCARKRNRAGVNLERRVFLKVNRHYTKLE